VIGVLESQFKEYMKSLGETAPAAAAASATAPEGNKEKR
jgi:hypothetical protein